MDTRYVGYSSTNAASAAVRVLYSPETIKYIQKVVFDTLKCSYPQGVIIPCKTIANVVDQVYSNFRPSTGDIYGRYTIPTNELAPYDDILNQVINILVSDVRNNIGIQVNDNLSIWTTVLGDFNREGLRSHTPIKVLDKHPQRGLFFENY